MTPRLVERARPNGRLRRWLPGDAPAPGR